MSGAENHVALIVDRTGPHVRLLCVKNFRQLWRKHQNAGVADRNSARVAPQQLGTTGRLPNNRLTSVYGQHKKGE